MTPKQILNWASAALICLLLGSLYRLDGPSDIEAMQDVADDVMDAASQAQAQAQALAVNTRGQQP